MARKANSGMTVVGPEKGIQCIVTDSGRVVTEEMMKAYELPSSKQISESMFKYDQTIDPPYDLAKLMGWMNMNVVHSSCVHTKVQDTVGIGFNIDPSEDNKVEKKENDPIYKQLMGFFNKVNDKEDITTLLKKVGIDWEGCGNAYIEVSRGASDGLVNGLYHVNATTIKWAREKDRLVQRVGSKYVWFKPFGEERILNRFDGTWQTEIEDVDKIANEIIPLTQYTWLSSVYGLPEWLPAVYNMFGSQKEQEFNIDFFLNFGVPAYALIVEGKTLSAEVQDEVSKYFKTNLQGSNHKTLTLSTPEGVKLRFERLSVETKESSFRMYHKDNRDTILTAHHVPPYRASIVEQGQLGGGVATETDRIYLDSVINPRQNSLTWLINEYIIRVGMEIEGWGFSFDDINIADQDRDSQIYQRYVNMGVMSPNEVRLELGLEPYEGGELYFMSGQLVPIGPNLEEPMAEGLTPEQESGEEPIDQVDPDEEEL